MRPCSPPLQTYYLPHSRRLRPSPATRALRAQIVEVRAGPVIVIRDATDRDAGLFMQDDGVLYAMVRTSASSNWQVDTHPIPSPSGPITNGKLHQVSPTNAPW